MSIGNTLYLTDIEYIKYRKHSPSTSYRSKDPHRSLFSSRSNELAAPKKKIKKIEKDICIINE